MAIPENTMWDVQDHYQVIVRTSADRVVATTGYKLLSFKSCVTIEKGDDVLEVFYLNTVIETVDFLVKHYEDNNEGLAELCDFRGVAKWFARQEVDWQADNADKIIALKDEFVEALQGHGLFAYTNDDVFVVYGNVNPNLEEYDHDGYVVEQNGDFFDIGGPDGPYTKMPNMVAAIAYIERLMKNAGYYPDIFYKSGDEYMVIVSSHDGGDCERWLALP